MITDKTTRQDLNLFSHDGKPSLFSLLNLTITTQGGEELFNLFQKPCSGKQQIADRQKTIASLLEKTDLLPNKISNGTIMVVEKMLETPFAAIPENVGLIDSLIYRIFNASDYSLLSYSLIHCADLISGMNEALMMLDDNNISPLLVQLKSEIKRNLPEEFLRNIEDNPSLKDWNIQRKLRMAKQMRFNFRNQIHALIQIHSRLDAWLSMAKAMKKFNLTFPVFLDSEGPVVAVEGMGHLLLDNPVRYDITLNRDHHFLFLTGANMAGKSTFIKSLGTSVYLAHLGMGVPCSSMRLSLFDGILTNINLQDDITKGESYFYQEVKRIKATIETVNGGKKWLILIDELFKGTNITDAMNCSLHTIQGLLKRKNAVFVLSTHLYEISETLKDESGILFRYFETEIKNDEYNFSYRLCQGVSQDKLGMLILKKEGVIELLNKRDG